MTALRTSVTFVQLPAHLPPSSNVQKFLGHTLETAESELYEPVLMSSDTSGDHFMRVVSPVEIIRSLDHNIIFGHPGSLLSFSLFFVST